MNEFYEKADNVVYCKAYDFAIRIVKANQFLRKSKKEYVLSKQLLRCGTSIGANIAAANGAISINDFSHKISIAYKEALETKYWLELLKDTQLFTENMYNSLFTDADEIAKILYSILKKTRLESEREPQAATTIINH